MENAYRIAALSVKQRFAEHQPEYLEVLKQIRKGQVVVFSGDYDQAEKVLEVLGIPAEVNPDKSGLMNANIAFVNCSGKYSGVLLNNIEAFVRKGGWLVSSDWALDKILETKFEGMVRWNKNTTGTEIISIEPTMDSLWSDIVVLGADPQWRLWGSHPIEVIDHEKVKIEAASHDLLAKYDAPVVAVRFDWEAGHVFHAIGHFWAKNSHTPTVRHTGPSRDFLKAGMKLSVDGIARVASRAKFDLDEVNFANVQSAATATELVAQLCVLATKDRVKLQETMGLLEVVKEWMAS
ncbi:MAG: hypothetical protein ACPGVB_09275 [Chitinophagales bacterium]